MEFQTEQDVPYWHCLQTNDTALVTAVYVAIEQLALDVEWRDGNEPWCLEVFCSPSQWRDLTKPIAQLKLEEIE